jgi:hypothetical protein
MKSKHNHINLKPEKDRLTQQLRVYVTKSEELDLKLKAEFIGMSFSSFARHTLLEESQRIKIQKLRGIRHELNKIGVNLNQLARKANASGELPLRKSIESFHKDIIETLKELG